MKRSFNAIKLWAVEVLATLNRIALACEARNEHEAEIAKAVQYLASAERHDRQSHSLKHEF